MTKEAMHSVLSLNEDDLFEVLEAAKKWSADLRTSPTSEQAQQAADRIDRATHRIRKQMFKADPS